MCIKDLSISEATQINNTNKLFKRIINIQMWRQYHYKLYKVALQKQISRQLIMTWCSFYWINLFLKQNSAYVPHWQEGNMEFHCLVQELKLSHSHLWQSKKMKTCWLCWHCTWGSREAISWSRLIQDSSRHMCFEGKIWSKHDLDKYISSFSS